MKSIALIGMMGCGKTTVGKLLAAALEREFVDLDQVIETAQNTSISSIFKEKGEAFFRELETKALNQYKNTSNLVISTGGGIVETEKNLEILEANFITIYLKTSPDVLFARIKDDTTRPLLQTTTPKKTLEKLLKKREKSYKKASKIVISDKKTPEEIMKEIQKCLELN